MTKQPPDAPHHVPAPAYGAPPMMASQSTMSDPTPSRYKVWRIVAGIAVVGLLVLGWWHWHH